MKYGDELISCACCRRRDPKKCLQLGAGRLIFPLSIFSKSSKGESRLAQMKRSHPQRQKRWKNIYNALLEPRLTASGTLKDEWINLIRTRRSTCQFDAILTMTEGRFSLQRPRKRQRLDWSISQCFSDLKKRREKSHFDHGQSFSRCIGKNQSPNSSFFVFSFSSFQFFEGGAKNRWAAGRRLLLSTGQKLGIAFRPWRSEKDELNVWVFSSGNPFVQDDAKFKDEKGQIERKR